MRDKALAALEQLKGEADRLYQLAYAIDKALQAERERAVKTAEKMAHDWNADDRYGRLYSAAQAIAGAIREGKPPE